jgi:hypothetical protein
MKIAIPSYNRASILKSKTLAYLLQEGFDPSEIVVFVKNDEQKTLYQKEISTPVTWVVCNNQNLCDKRTFISHYFPLDEEIVAVDDDIKTIKMLHPKPLREVLTTMFTLTRKEELTTWGIYPVNNLFFCKERVVRGSCYLIGCFFGFINKEHTVFPNLYTKEDKWWSCYNIQKDGAVLRYEGICPDTTYYASGGQTGIRTLELEEEHSKDLEKLFPTLVKYKLKKNGHPDVDFVRKPKFVLSFSSE